MRRLALFVGIKEYSVIKCEPSYLILLVSRWIFLVCQQIEGPHAFFGIPEILPGRSGNFPTIAVVVCRDNPFGGFFDGALDNHRDGLALKTRHELQNETCFWIEPQ